MSDDAPAEDRSIRGLTRLAGLTDEQFDSVLRVLDGSEVFIDVESVMDGLMRAVPGLDSEDANLLAGLGLATVETDIVFAGGGTRAIRTRVERVAALTETSEDALVRRLENFVASPALGMLGGAISSQRRSRGVFVRSYLATEMRPILPDGMDVPKMYTVSHRLQVTIANDPLTSEEESFEVVLDHEDLEIIARQVAKALGDQNKLQKNLYASGASVFFPWGGAEEADD